MPPLPKLKSGALQRLEGHVRSKGRGAVLADVGRAEELAGVVDPAVTYPEDWVVFRVTGQQASLSKPEMLKGEELRGELSSFVERLCAAASCTLADVGPCVDAAALCKHWNISGQTLTRLRRRGLVARRVVDAKARAKLVFRTEVVNRFQAAHRDGLLRASSFSRMGKEAEEKVLARAAELRASQSLTLSQAAAVIAKELGRSHEGVRQILRRAERRASASRESPVFGEAPALAREQQDLLYRAWRRGVDLSVMARKVRRSRGAVRRAISMGRARYLGLLAFGGRLEIPAVPAFAAKNAAATILSPAPVRTGLTTTSAPDVGTFLRQAHAQGPPIGAEEKARLLAYQFLRFDIGRRIEALSRLQPSAGALDRIETNLRWAARLKVELVASQFKLMLEALQARLGKPVEQFPGNIVVPLLGNAIHAVGLGVDSFDPTRGGRLAAATTLRVDRVARDWDKQLIPAATKRATMLVPSGLVMSDWVRTCPPWRDFFEPAPRLRRAVASGKLGAALSTFLAQRYGWDGGPPHTLAELAEERKINQVAVFRLETRAKREAAAIG